MEGRIMVVDDDRSLLGLTAKYLARHGFQVTSCTGSDEAWRLFSAPDAGYDVVVIDFTLAGTSGPQLARRMLEQNAAVWLVLTSGFHMDPKALDGAGGASRVAFLHKPFSPAMLVETISSLIRKTHAD